MNGHSWVAGGKDTGRMQVHLDSHSGDADGAEAGDSTKVPGVVGKVIVGQEAWLTLASL